MNSIKEWLHGARNYVMGVALFKAHSSNTVLYEMFAQGFSPYRAERLLQEMEALSSLKVTVALPSVSPTPIALAIREEVLPENIPTHETDPYREKWLPIYAEMNFLRHNLLNAKNDQERGELAHKILDMEQQCMNIWHQRDYFLKYKEHLPEINENYIITDRNELHRKLMNIRTYITKATKKLSDNPEDVKAMSRVVRYREEASRIEKQLEIA